MGKSTSAHVSERLSERSFSRSADDIFTRQFLGLTKMTNDVKTREGRRKVSQKGVGALTDRHCSALSNSSSKVIN